MKSKNVTIGAGIVVLIAIIWTVGFIMGNASATRRSAEAETAKDVIVWNDLDNGDVEAAKRHTRVYISGGRWFLKQKPFWVAALKDHWNVDSERLYKEASDQIEDIVANGEKVDEAK